MQESSQSARADRGDAAQPAWRALSQEALDDAYDQSKYAPNQRQVQQRRNLASARARDALGPPLRLAYGPSEIERLDLYRTDRPGAPVVVLVHGGAWRGGKASEHGYAAETFVNAGAHFAVLGFINVAEAGGSLVTMVEQLRRALGFLFHNAGEFGGDADRLYLAGHSSGAHLSGCAVTHDWRGEGFPADMIKGALLISGMYDLAPVRRSKRSAYVAFTDAMEQDLSPQRHIEALNTPLILAHGTLESPEFQRQTRDFHAAVTAAGKPAELIIGEGYNHFEMAETLANPYGLLGRAALRLMRLPPYARSG